MKKHRRAGGGPRNDPGIAHNAYNTVHKYIDQRISLLWSDSWNMGLGWACATCPAYITNNSERSIILRRLVTRAPNRHVHEI